MTDHSESGLMPPGASLPLSPVPDVPVIKPNEDYEATPYVLSGGDWQYSIGWQRRPPRKGGDRYVVARRTHLGGFKVLESFPLTETGWAKAWKALVRVDKQAAGQILDVLALRAAEKQAQAALADLDARTLGYVPEALFLGGSGAHAGLTVGHPYDVRFLADRLVVVQPRRADVLFQLGYAGIETIDVTGPGSVQRWSALQQVMFTEAFGAIGEVASRAATRIQTVVHVQTHEAEFFFLYAKALPHVLRVELSPALTAFRESTRGPGPGDEAGGPVSIVDELTRLAGMLDSGLLTREEFEDLKAKLIARS